MKLEKVDTIVKLRLMKDFLSIHHYIQRAYLALEFIREINFDSAYFIKTVTVEIVDNKITLPDDYIGLVRLGIKNGQYVDELAPNERLLSNDDEVDVDGESSTYPFWYANINKYGENQGGYFGYSSVSRLSYKVILEENKILINNRLSTDYETTELVLQYVTDGLITGKPFDESDDGVVYVHPYAIPAMNAYVEWQLAISGKRLDARAPQSRYYNELRKYRARINPITDEMLKRSLRRGYKSSPKN